MTLIKEQKIYGGLFDPEEKEKRVKELELEVNKENFWSDKKNSERIIEELNSIKNNINEIKSLKQKIKDNIDIINGLKEEKDEEIKSLVEEEIKEIKEKLDNLEILLLLNANYG